MGCLLGTTSPSGRLTWPAIRRRYPDEWVMLVDLDDDEDDPAIRSAVVIGHGPSRKELFAATQEHIAARCTTSACRFTGEEQVPAGALFLNLRLGSR